LAGSFQNEQKASNIGGLLENWASRSHMGKKLSKKQICAHLGRFIPYGQVAANIGRWLPTLAGSFQNVQEDSTIWAACLKIGQVGLTWARSCQKSRFLPI
jgi:hypothetical protein